MLFHREWTAAVFSPGCICLMEFESQLSLPFLCASTGQAAVQVTDLLQLTSPLPPFLMTRWPSLSRIPSWMRLCPLSTIVPASPAPPAGRGGWSIGWVDGCKTLDLHWKGKPTCALKGRTVQNGIFENRYGRSHLLTCFACGPETLPPPPPVITH